MKNAFLVLALACLAAPAFAQQPPASPQAPAPQDLAAGLKGQWASIRRNIAASAEKMTEADYGFKPQGVPAEVRSYGELLTHVSNSAASTCARVKGDPPRPAVADKAPRAEVIKALTDALAYCDTVYDTQTTASLTEMMKVQGRNNTTREVARGLSLISNISHLNEHYGNLVTYMRAKGIVPPSSEGR